MNCVKFWLDDPIEVIQNISSIIPREGQCINEKLNALSFFSIVFSIILYLAKVPYAWLFALVGLGSAIFLKLVFFSDRYGDLTFEQYKEIKTMDDLERYLTDDETELVHHVDSLTDEFHDEALFIDTSPHDLRVRGDTFENLKAAVADDLLRSRIPNVIPLTKTLGDICVI